MWGSETPPLYCRQFSGATTHVLLPGKQLLIISPKFTEYSIIVEDESNEFLLIFFQNVACIANALPIFTILVLTLSFIDVLYIIQPIALGKVTNCN